MLTIKNPKECTDEEVVKLIVEKREHDHFGILYDRYVEKVYHKCISFVKDEAIAQDLTHDIFLKTFVNLIKFNHESRFSTWLYSLTYNFCIDYIRKNKKQTFQSDESLSNIPDDEDAKNEQEIFQMEALRLSEILDSLEPDEKAILLMKYQDDMSIKDISSALNASESAVKMRIKRTKAKAVELYQKNYGHER